MARPRSSNSRSPCTPDGAGDWEDLGESGAGGCRGCGAILQVHVTSTLIKLLCVVAQEPCKQLVRSLFLSSQDDLLRRDRRFSDSYGHLKLLEGSKMISQVSQQRSSTSHKSLASLHSIGRLHSFSSEADGDPIKVKMTPRVAVRDKTPHRFQVVPLREISQRPTDGVNALALPNLRQNQNRLRGACTTSSSSHSASSPSLVGNAYLRFPIIESKTHASHF